MKLAKFRLLEKLMERTTSESDNEALTAIRAANRLLKNEDASWDKFFKARVVIQDDFEEAPPGHYNEPPKRSTHNVDRADAQEIEEAFTILSDTRDGMNSFIVSLHQQWLERRSLSHKQKAALLNAADRAHR